MHVASSPRPLRLVSFWLLLLTTLGVRAQPEAPGSLPPVAMIQRANVLGSVLMIGAHADDDDTQLLTYLSLGLQLRTGYLSVGRSLGSQNRIGPEQGQAMAVLLNQEAIAARQRTHIEQYYTRAFDAGFTKTLTEAMTFWDRPEVVGDIVWLLRTFRPDAVIVRYSGTPRDGHGHHQASAVLARKAIAAAGDPTQFPEQLKLTTVWKPAHVFQFSAAGAKPVVAINVGGYNPVLGASYAEIATAGRTAFRSQAMGGLTTLRNRTVLLAPIDGTTPETLLEGVDTTWKRMTGGEAIGEGLAAVLREFRADQPEQAVAGLVEARTKLAALEKGADGPWVRVKLHELDETIARCVGLWVRVATPVEVVTPGMRVPVAIEVANRSVMKLEVAGLTLKTPTGENEFPAQPLGRDQPARWEAYWAVPADQVPTQPYWLQGQDGMIAKIADQTKVGPAADEPLLTVRLRFRTEDGAFELTRAVRHQRFEPTEGETWRPLVVTPPVTLHPALDAVIFPDGAPRKFSVRATAHRDDVAGTVKLQLPAGWGVEPATGEFRIAKTGLTSDLVFTVTPPAASADSRAKISAVVDGRETAFDFVTVDYPHIERATFFPATDVRFVHVPVKVLAKRVGYLIGTGDEMPEALRQLNCEVTLLSPDDLARADLTIYDAVVLGIRSYSVRPDVLLHRDRLRAYVRGGGTLVMQYTDSTAGPNGIVEVPNLGPFAFRVGATRVVEEDAPMKFRLPQHPLLHVPNELTAEDFRGWVQERGLRFAVSWDAHYETPLETNDSGEAPLPGGMLVAREGQGVFVYTAYAWFRQLPAGVPGAYRVFANILSAGRAGK